MQSSMGPCIGRSAIIVYVYVHVLEMILCISQQRILDSNIRTPASQLKKVVKCGTLYRQSSFFRVWKEQYIVVTEDSLMYWYGSQRDSLPEDVIALKKATGVRREEVAGRDNTFVVTAKNPSFNMLAPKAPVVYPFSASGPAEMEAWLRVIGKAIVRSVAFTFRVIFQRIMIHMLTLAALMECFCGVAEPGQSEPWLLVVLFLFHPLSNAHAFSPILALCSPLCHSLSLSLPPCACFPFNDIVHRSATTTEWDETSDRIDAQQDEVR